MYPLSSSPAKTGGDYASPLSSKLFCTSSSNESQSYNGLLNDAEITNIVPRTRSLSVTIYPCCLERDTAKVFGITAREPWWRKVADMERISKQPWKVTMATVALMGVKEGWWRVTLAMVPELVKTHTSMFFLRLKRARREKGMREFQFLLF